MQVFHVGQCHPHEARGFACDRNDQGFAIVLRPEDLPVMAIDLLPGMSVVGQEEPEVPRPLSGSRGR